MRKILAVHPDADMLDLMSSALKERLPDVLMEKVRYASDAQEQCRAQKEDPFRVVIANLSIAADFRARGSQTENKGMEFLEWLEQAGHGDAQKILIADTASNGLLARTERLRNCRLLLMDDSTGFEDAFVAAVSRAIEQATNGKQEEEPGQVKVVVSLDLENQLWNYQLKGVGGFTYTKPPVPLQMDSRTLKSIVRRSRWAGDNSQDWEDELLDIGQAFGKLLLYDNPGFLSELKDAQNKVGGEERKSICFSIDKSVHPAALEALTPPSEDSFWMLRVPMYRQLIRSGQKVMDRPVLFNGRGRGKEPFNALIIESPAEGVVGNLKDSAGRPLQLDTLANVTEEADAVEKILAGKAVRLRRIRPQDTPAGSTFKTFVKDVLGSDQWDWVHYAGHSHYDEATGKGYLLFPGEYVDALDIELFNTYLDRAKTRFLYLSGCKSSEAGFVFELARLQIPGVLGFRWPINDWAALEFARTFYQCLFEKGGTPRLDSAFLSTRCAIRDAYKQDKIWASAMLILQDSD